MLMAYALKKIIKWTLILGVFVGIIFLVIQYMANNGYITGKILWTKMGNDLFLVGQQIDVNSIHGLLPHIRNSYNLGLRYRASRGVYQSTLGVGAGRK